MAEELASGYVREKSLETENKSLDRTLESIMHRKTQKQELTIDHGKEKKKDLDMGMER